MSWLQSLSAMILEPPPPTKKYPTITIVSPSFAMKFWASLVAPRLKRLPAMRETWVGSLDQKDPLEKEMANHSRILSWRIPWMEDPGGLQSTGSQRVGHD